MSQVLHFVLILIGAFFLYTAIFTYEDENKKIQNKLADIYLDIQIAKEKYSTIRALMIKASEILSSFFARYFDDGELTPRFIGMYGVLYICFFCYLTVLVNIIKPDEGIFACIFSNPQYLLYCAVLIAVVFLASIKLNGRVSIYFLIVLFGLTFATSFTIRNYGLSSGLKFGLEFLIPFIVSIFCFKLNIMVIKWNIKVLVDKESRLLIIPLLAVIMTAICGFMYSIFLLFDMFDQDFLGSGTVFIAFLPVSLLIVTTNTAFIVLFLAIAANKIIFPIVAEPIRSLYEHNLIKNKKTLAAIGFLFLLIAYPSIMDNSVIRAVKDLFK
ncbi:MAG TPA: hypothetical protein VFE53_21970 [Mucilaginibacter sp.]|jgi:hypothetical protein|nr:hypothetical protein [Mucilaginibacter sp.]